MSAQIGGRRGNARLAAAKSREFFASVPAKASPPAGGSKQVCFS
jgi:hypothetical protein